MRIDIVRGPKICNTEQIAVDDLVEYLKRLFDVDATVVMEPSADADALLIVGNPSTNEHTKNNWRQVSEQGVVIRRGPDNTITVGGGSPAATLWAVSRLAQCYGICHLLEEDVYPPPGEPDSFHLPEVDIAEEPTMSVRSWRVINDLGFGPECWGIEDYKPVLHQLAKLSYNCINVSIYPFQPFLDLQIDGIKRDWSTLCYDFKYPITDDMPGRELFGDEPEYWNPDLPPRDAPYSEAAAAGEKLVHEIIACANALGMKSMIPVAILEYPKEFEPLVLDAQPVHQLGRLTIVPGPNVPIDDEQLFHMAAEVLRATVNTYPEVDYYSLALPEFVSWTDVYEEAWNHLISKYGSVGDVTLESILEDALKQGEAIYTGIGGGAQRSVKELKGGIAALYFMDKLVNDPQVLASTAKPDALFIQATSEWLYPLLSKILPEGSLAHRALAYTPARALLRPEAFVPTDLPTVTTFSLHDDNIGTIPQLCTNSLHGIRVAMQKVGWDGFTTRYWMISDHDPCLAYLAKATWDADATPQQAYEDQVRAVCGEAAIEPMLNALALLEEVTVDLEIHGMGFAFVVPETGTRQFTQKPGKDTLKDDMLESIRDRYTRAAGMVKQAGLGDNDAAKRYLRYWHDRLVFGAQYMTFAQMMRSAAVDRENNEKEQAVEKLAQAEQLARQAIQTMAGVSRNRCDRGAVALMAQYLVRDVAQLRQNFECAVEQV
jgi:hypothetical protein